VSETVPQIDPVTFQILRHRLDQAIEEGIDALKRVSGSPTTNEGHDMMLSLYTASGELMVGGVGFLHHLTSAAQAVKHIVADFSEDPGIYEGDTYMLNDSYTAALHSSDIYMISPVVNRGLLRGFVANFVHATDIGGIDPGGFCPNATSSFHEGFVTKGLKIVDRGNVKRDVVETFLNVVREPGLVALDLRSQLAANHAAIAHLQRMFDEFGAETIDAVGQELIRQTDLRLRHRLLELPDGTWRMRQYVDWPDKLHRVDLAMTKDRDVLTFDFTGTSEQSVLGVNDSYWATWGAVFAPIFPLLAWDMTWNEGVIRHVQLNAPEGSLVNCVRPAPVSIATVAMIKVVNNMVSLLIGRMLGASERYAHRAMAVWDGVHSAIHWAGVAKDGRPFLSYSTDAFAGAGGAHADGDGVDIGGEIPNGVSRWANVETHELSAPVSYLYRRAVTDSGGPGKYRGGVSHEFAVCPHKTNDGSMEIVLTTQGLGVPLSIGLSGGYPGCTTGSTIFRNANVVEMPESLETTRGSSSEAAPWGDFHLGPDDVFYHRFQGGGGYGDPLERDPEAVAGDVAAELVSQVAACDIYGVVLSADGSVDEKGTRARRIAIRVDRIGSSVTAPCQERRAVASSGKRISEYLQACESGVQCTWCGFVFATGDRHWKYAAIRRDRGIEAAGALRQCVTGLMLREYFCPRCGTVLDVESAKASDPVSCDEIRVWPPTEEGGREPYAESLDGRAKSMGGIA
jgi:N-methylhydantoinase B